MQPNAGKALSTERLATQATIDTDQLVRGWDQAGVVKVILSLQSFSLVPENTPRSGRTFSGGIK